MKISALIGKGGVGKSTLAVCLASYFKENLAMKTVCVGLDQQHNHKDIIITYGLNLDYKMITNKISDMVKDTIENCFMKGFTEYTSGIMPEFLAITELAELTNQIKDNVEQVVIDMPPNTSALTLLNMPNILNNIAFKGLTLRNRIHRMTTGHDVALENMEYMTEISNNFRLFMKNADYYVVGILTQLGLIEVKKAIIKLEELNYSCKAIILNMVEPIPDADSKLLFERYKNANAYLNLYNIYAKKKGIPVIQIRFSYDLDYIMYDLELGFDDFQF